jgi:ribonuclease HI
VKGVYTDWPTAQEQITGWHKPEFKGFSTRHEAEEFVRGPTLDSNNEPLQKKSKIFDENYELPAGYGPLPPGAEDGFDHTLTLDSITGEVRKKTAAELGATKAVPRAGPASTGEYIKIWTDGACRGNGKKGAMAGVGVWFGPNDDRNVSERLIGDRQTNQRAELVAIKRALDMCPLNRNAHIVSDSNYAIKCVTEWFISWEANSWKSSTGKAVENRDIVEEIILRIREREMCKAKTKFEWVKGHSDNFGNNAADGLAVKGALMAQLASPPTTVASEVEAVSELLGEERIEQA